MIQGNCPFMRHETIGIWCEVDRNSVKCAIETTLKHINAKIFENHFSSKTHSNDASISISVCAAEEPLCRIVNASKPVTCLSVRWTMFIHRAHHSLAERFVLKVMINSIKGFSLNLCSPTKTDLETRFSRIISTFSPLNSKLPTDLFHGKRFYGSSNAVNESMSRYPENITISIKSFTRKWMAPCTVFIVETKVIWREKIICWHGMSAFKHLNRWQRRP